MKGEWEDAEKVDTIPSEEAYALLDELLAAEREYRRYILPLRRDGDQGDGSYANYERQYMEWLERLHGTIRDLFVRSGVLRR